MKFWFVKGKRDNWFWTVLWRLIFINFGFEYKIKNKFFL